MRRAAWILCVAGFAAACGAAACGCVRHRLSPGEMKEDLDVLFGQIDRHVPDPYVNCDRSALAARRQALYRQIGRPLTVPEFYKIVAPAVASLRIGHTMVHPPEKAFDEHLELGGKVFPLAVRFDRSGATVAASYARLALPVGGRILSINGEDAGRVFARLARCFPAERRDNNPWALEDPWLLWLALWLEYGPAESLKLRIRDGAGKVAEHVVEAVDDDQPVGEVGRRRKSLPWADYSFRRIAKPAAVVIQVNSFTGREYFEPFVRLVFSQVRAAGVKDLIIDLRGNAGGEVLLAELLFGHLTDRPFRLYEKAITRATGAAGRRGATIAHVLPEAQPGPEVLRFAGRTYVLIGPRTASAGAAFAAAIRHYKVGTLVGEETVDLKVTHGRAHRFVLPNSKLRASVAATRAFCVGAGDDGGPVVPDHHVRQKPEDAARGVDTALQFTLRLLRRGRT